MTDTSTNPVESGETPAEDTDATAAATEGAATEDAETDDAATDRAEGDRAGASGADGDNVGDDDAAADDAAPGDDGKAKDADALFAESEIAADYIEGLLDILDYDGDIDELVQSGRPMVELVGTELDPLVGQRGATLEALQELARLAVFRETGSPSRLLLDVAGFRQARRKELAAIAKNAVEKIREHGEPVKLEAMTAFERKCVHDVVNELSDVASESEGVEPNRRVVVRPVE